MSRNSYNHLVLRTSRAKIDYRIERKYTPDFVYEKQGVTYYIECKGYFRAGDTQKYERSI